MVYETMKGGCLVDVRKQLRVVPPIGGTDASELGLQNRVRYLGYDHAYELRARTWEEFGKLMRMFPILSELARNPPKSIYDLAKVLNLDPSNLHKSVLFLESLDVIKIIEKSKGVKKIRQPIARFDVFLIDVASERVSKREPFAEDDQFAEVIKNIGERGIVGKKRNTNPHAHT